MISLRFVNFVLSVVGLAERIHQLFHRPVMPERTIVGLSFANGKGRTFSYNRLLPDQELQQILDALLDEMQGMPVDAPIEVLRVNRQGETELECIGMYDTAE